MHERVIDETKKYINQVMDEGLDQGNNLEYLDKLIDIQKNAYKIKCMKEDKEMYGNYGNYPSHNYGRYDHDEYGARARDSRGRYRGHEHLDRMYDYYGRYMDGHDRYGTSDNTDKSFHYMVEALEDFIRVLHEEAETSQQKQILDEALQRSMR